MSERLDVMAERLLSCPTCAAEPGGSCRTTSGNQAASTHRARVDPLIEAWGAGYEEAEGEAERWWISPDMIGKPGSPIEGGPFSSMHDAMTARTILERRTRPQTFSVFREDNR